MVTDPYLCVQVLLIYLLAAPVVWPQTPAPVPVRFLTRVRAAIFSSAHLVVIALSPLLLTNDPCNLPTLFIQY